MRNNRRTRVISWIIAAAILLCTVPATSMANIIGPYEYNDEYVINYYADYTVTYDDGNGNYFTDLSKAEKGKPYRMVLYASETEEAAFITAGEMYYILPDRFGVISSITGTNVNGVQDGQVIKFSWTNGKKSEFSATITFTLANNVYDLYNIANINNTYYRLAKTTITTDKVLSENLGKKLNASDYTMPAYDFTNLKITVNNKEYVYKCPENEEIIKTGGKYYTATFDNLDVVTKKIGALDKNNKPRWLVPEDQQYNDPNNIDSYHANYIIKLYEEAYEQDLYNMLQVGNSKNYYRLRKSRILALDLSKYKAEVPAGDYYIDSEYDFTNVLLTVNGETYKYSDHELTEEEKEGGFESYYTARMSRVIKQDRINGDDSWYANDDGWLDGSKEQYGSEGNEVTAYHRDYLATLFKGNLVFYSVEIHNDDQVTTIRSKEGSIPELPVPEKEGYTFTGWKDAQGADFDENTPLTANVTLYAQWTENHAAAEETDEDMYILISADVPEGSKVFAGSRITLFAHTYGFENKNYTLQWQYSLDQENWIDVPNGIGETYTYTIDADNARYTWRVIAINVSDK